MYKKMNRIHKNESNTPSYVKNDKELLNNIKSKLHINDCLSYKQITDLLNIKYAGGKQRQLQIKKLSNYIDYEFDSVTKKYLILNIKEN